MIRIALRSLWSRKLRTVLTLLAILLGVAMISGTYVLTDQINNGFDEIFKKSYQGTDVEITRKSVFTGANYFAPPGSLPESLLAQVKATPGVGEAEGVAGATGAVIIDGKPVTTGGAPTLVYSTAAERFSQSKYTSGAPPARHGEVSINHKLSDDKNLKEGDHIGLTTAFGVEDVVISGVFNFGDSASLGGATIVQTTLADAQDWYELEGQFSTIMVAAGDGVTPDELAARLEEALPAYAQVKTGKQSAEDASQAISDALGSVLTPALLAFGGVAVIVGAFIIFNAFSITVAQRLREFAMLRSLGATRRQVLLTVLGEALVMGVIASAAGLLAGFGVAKGINAMFKAVGADVPTAGAALAPRTIVVALAVGIGVAVLAAMAPALRATRVPPVAALQEGAVLPPSFVGRFSSFIAAAVALAAVLALTRGMFASDPSTVRLLFLGLGVIGIFVAVAMMSKYIVRPVAGAIGWPLEKVARVSGRLARENSARNPARTAATAAALMIGLAVVVFVAVFAQGLKASFVDAIDKSVNATFVISGQNGAPFPAQSLDAARSVFTVDDAAGIYVNQAQVRENELASAIGVNPASFGRLWHFAWLRGGNDAALGRLAGNNALIEEQFALKFRLRPGSSFTAVAPTGEKATFKVIGEYRDPVLMTGFVIPQTTFDDLFAGMPNEPLYAVVTTSGDEAQVTDQLQAALKSFPTAELRTKAEFTDMMKQQVNQILTLLYALLAVSVIISIFGIVNTLVLSVYERTREIGMLRAIGTTRRQMRRIVRYESVITSIIGGVLGCILGVLFAWVVTTRLAAQGITFSVPWLQLVVFLVVAAVVGVLAAVLPARRAANLNILEAIHYE
ncbi:MAG TPA: FtsX-like permease family protein [Thermoleophilia bacterium]|nr:FtsX-like permease family protein [Thermoleophilia bacterium]